MKPAALDSDMERFLSTVSDAKKIMSSTASVEAKWLLLQNLICLAKTHDRPSRFLDWSRGLWFEFSRGEANPKRDQLTQITLWLDAVTPRANDFNVALRALQAV